MIEELAAKTDEASRSLSGDLTRQRAARGADLGNAMNLSPGTVVRGVHGYRPPVAAYMPPKVVKKLISADVARQGGRSDGVVLITRKDETRITETRRHGLSRTIGQPIPGIRDSFCRRMFDSHDLCVGITAIDTKQLRQ